MCSNLVALMKVDRSHRKFCTEKETGVENFFNLPVSDRNTGSSVFSYLNNQPKHFNYLNALLSIAKRTSVKLLKKKSQNVISSLSLWG